MICQTVRAGMNCSFMSPKGCNYIDGSCKAIIEECGGCNKITEVTSGKYCTIYPEPQARWAYGICPTASHVKKEVVEVVQKLNPLKASKRASGKKK